MTILKPAVSSKRLYFSSVVSCRDWDAVRTDVLHHKMSTMNELQDSGAQLVFKDDYVAAYFTLGNPLKRRQVNDQRRFLSEEPAPTPRVVYRDRSLFFVLALLAFPPYIDWKPGKATVYNMVHVWQTGRYKNCHSNLLRRGNAATTSPLPPQPMRRRPLLLCSPRRRCCFQLHVIRFHEPNAMSLLTRTTLSY